MKTNFTLNILLVLFVAICSLLFITVFFKFFPNLNILKPNLILLVVIYIAIYRSLLAGAGIVFAISYINNLGSPSFIGGEILVNLIIFFVLNYLSHQLYIRNLKMLLLLIPSVVIAEKILFLFFLYYFRDITLPVWFVVKRLFFEIIMDTVFAVFIFQILKSIDRRTGVKKEKTDFFTGPVYLRRA